MTRSVAFYLPQFHAIPENDRWWGEGFTDWRNTAEATPRFDGHYQPHIPGELGYYDLRAPEARAAQAELASVYAVDAFCYYHYWFSGRRLLEQPFDAVLHSGEPDHPFALCWANEAWTRSWSGGGEILVEQRYDEADDLAHVRWLVAAFTDPRYVRVDGKPLFLVYRAGQLPDAHRTTDLWRAEASRLGIGELFLARVESFRTEHTDPGRTRVRCGGRVPTRLAEHPSFASGDRGAPRGEGAASQRERAPAVYEVRLRGPRPHRAGPATGRLPPLPMRDAGLGQQPAPRARGRWWSSDRARTGTSSGSMRRWPATRSSSS